MTAETPARRKQLVQRVLGALASVARSRRRARHASDQQPGRGATTTPSHPATYRVAVPAERRGTGDGARLADRQPVVARRHLRRRTTTRRCSADARGRGGCDHCSGAVPGAWSQHLRVADGVAASPGARCAAPSPCHWADGIREERLACPTYRGGSRGWPQCGGDRAEGRSHRGGARPGTEEPSRRCHPARPDGPRRGRRHEPAAIASRRHRPGRRPTASRLSRALPG